MTVEKYLALPASTRSGNPEHHEPNFPGDDNPQQELPLEKNREKKS